MIRFLALVAAIFPVLTVVAWGKFNALDQKHVTEYVTKVCTKNAAEDKVPQVLDAIENFEKCSTSLFKDEVLLEEVATAIRSNDLNGVFKKYCARTPRIAACLYSLVDSLALCIAGSNVPAAHNFIDQLLGFICHNDGERIGREYYPAAYNFVNQLHGFICHNDVFIQDGGPQCFQQNMGSLNNCAGKVLTELNASQPDLKERCERFDELSTCMADGLKTCASATPSNMTQALFSHLRQALPCAGDTYTSWLQERTTH